MMQTQASTAIAEQPKYCLYARKSTESDEKQALSIDSQIKEMLVLAQREGIEIIDILRESHSAKETGQRPVFNVMIEGIRSGKYNAILTWAPDRLSRNAGDLGSLVDMMDQGRILNIRTYGQNFSNNPNEKFLLMILGSQAKLENDNKGVNVKRGLRTRCEMGMWPTRAPTGYLNNPNRNKKCEPIIDPKRGPIIRQMFEKVAYENWSGRKVYRWLRDIDFKTVYGKPLSLANVYIILENHFYYGTFEYPKSSNNWYQGKHAPLVSKDLFDTVREIMSSGYVERTETKEFAFTKLMKCGKCGSGITADEKFKKLKDDTYNRHVYYICTRSRNIDCTNKNINETNLIEELMRLVDEVDLDELGIQEKVIEELKRYNHFQKNVLKDGNEGTNKKDIDIRDYAKYILRDGILSEKRELLIHLKSKLVLEDQKIRLEKL